MAENNTFKREVTFLSNVVNEDTNILEKQTVTKEVTFNELDETNSNQHLLHFLIASILEYKKGEGGGEDKIFIEHDKMYKLAVESIKNLMVLGDGITETDKTQILANSFALINFGDWFATNKAVPFFIKSRISLVK
jgi:hypothetical protein